MGEIQVEGVDQRIAIAGDTPTAEEARRILAAVQQLRQDELAARIEPGVSREPGGQVMFTDAETASAIKRGALPPFNPGRAILKGFRDPRASAGDNNRE